MIARLLMPWDIQYNSFVSLSPESCTLGRILQGSVPQKGSVLFTGSNSYQGTSAMGILETISLPSSKHH